MASTSKPSSANAHEKEKHIETLLENSMAFVEELDRCSVEDGRNGLLINSFVRAMKSFLLKGRLIGDKKALSETLAEVFQSRPELLKEYSKVLAQAPSTRRRRRRRREENEGIGVACNPSYRLFCSETEIINPDEVLNRGWCVLEPPDFIPRPKKESERERRLNRLEDERFEAEMLVRRLRLAEGNATALLWRLEDQVGPGSVRVDDHLTRRDAACIEEVYGKRRSGPGVMSRLRSDPRPEILRDVMLRLKRKRDQCETNLIFHLKMR